MNRRSLSSAVILLFLALTMNVAIAQDAPSAPGEAATAADPLTIGSPAAQLSIEHWLSDAGGKFAPVTDLEAGKVYVVEFWATWCRPCVGCMPHLAEIQSKYNDLNVQVISISDEDLETVEEFLELDYKPSKAKKGEGAAEEGSPPTPKTYAELTSVYCLTTDPDRSVYDAYQRASGRRGIPSAFIVGKTGLIEWMGHPTKMDDALKSVVNDSWDRAAFAKEYQTEQNRDLMLARLTPICKTGPPEKAKKAINEALKEFADDEVATAKLNGMMGFIVMTPLYDFIDAGENIKAITLIKELSPTVGKKVQRQLLGIQVKLQLEESLVDEAVKTLALVASDESYPAASLTRIVRNVYMESKKNKELPQDMFGHGITLAQRAVDADGNNPFYLSTLACIQRAAGDLDDAIATQVKAVAKSGGANKGYQVILDQLNAEKASMDKVESK